MSRVDPLGNRCDHTLKVHIRRMDASVANVEQSVACAQRIYGPHGIYFDVASATSVAMGEADRNRLATLDTSCTAGQDSDEQAELYAMLVVQEPSITAIFVREIATYVGEVHGCAS